MRILLLFLGLIIFESSYSQDNFKIKKRTFKVADEGFDQAWDAVKQADKLFSKGQTVYINARELYKKAWNYNSGNAQLNYKLGICYLNTDQKGEAVTYFKKALEIDPKISIDIHFLLGRSLQMKGEFNDAIKYFNISKSTLTKRQLKKLKVNIDWYIDECQNALVIVNEPARVIISNAGKELNSTFDDFYPVVLEGEQKMYFNSLKTIENKKKKLDKYRSFAHDIYVSEKENENWGKPKLVADLYSKTSNNAIIDIAADEKTMYIYREEKGMGDIYVCKWDDEDKVWNDPKSFKKINNRGSNESSGSLSPKGDKFYFISDNDEESFGGKDIYYTTLEKGKWTKPRNIGFPINTLYNEEAVFIAADDKTLYFSSKGHSSMGGYDIFKSVMDNSGKWSKPVNIGYPINTPDDDLFFRIQANNKVAYYTTIKEGSLGEKDIFKVVFLGAEKEMIALTDVAPMAFLNYDKIDLFNKKIETVTIDTSIYLSGRILDKKTQMPLMSKIEFIDSDISKVISTSIVDSTGVYRVSFPKKKNYGVQITSNGYLLFLDIVDLLKLPGDDKLIKDFLLTKLEVGTKVVMKNIFFPNGKATLLPESYAELGKVLIFLQDNATLKLEISGHTDNLGGAAINKKLSESRAKSVVNYLVSQGVDESRLTYVGYGPAQPVASNKTKAGQAQNRRVEFKIVGK